MSNGNHGLRFDIYERVHLPENVAAIDELEEIELVPRIQVIEQGENAILQGQLVLNGIYRAQGTEDEQVALEHWIPVEITLPMNRITTLDEVTVDIDTFDVVLLSSRALNLTGILSLRGIVLEQEQEADEWDAEVFTVSHSRGEEESSEEEGSFEYDEQQNYDQQSYELQQDEGEYREAYAEGELHQAVQYEQAEQESEAFTTSEHQGHLSFLQQLEQRYGQYEQQGYEQQSYEQQAYEPQHAVQQNEYAQYQYRTNEQEEQGAAVSEEAQSNYAPVLESNSYLTALSSESTLQNEEEQPREAEEAESVHSVNDQGNTAQQQSSDDEAQWSSWETAEAEGARQPDAPSEQSFQQEEELQHSEPEIEAIGQSLAEPPIQRELHIALNGNKEQNEVQGIRTILNSSLREQAAQQAATIQQQEQDRQRDEQEKQRSHDEQIEWQQLFLNKRPDQNEFKRIRMCIVQKEDTLELIATRYSVNPRELLLRNNLHESAITEGQLLYIP